ncbi:MAG: hypothetical protein FJ098_09245, partial [Deltaproteobacteria bacterium]|nr:hypothetical protein [Deltaproteobacteria bacterium]
LLVRRALDRPRPAPEPAGDDPKEASFSRLFEVPPETGSLPSTQALDLLVRTLAAQGVEPPAVAAAARDAMEVQLRGLDPGGEVRETLATTLESVEAWEGALELRRLQQALGEGAAEPYLAEFGIHLLMGDVDGARETVWRCLATTPGTAVLLARFADRARRGLELDLSAELFALSLRLDPGNRILALAGAEPLLLLGREEDAEALLERYAEQGTPERVEAAGLAFRADRFALADRLLSGSQAPSALLEKARNRIRAGEADTGWRLLEEAIRSGAHPARAARSLLVGLLEAPRPDLLLVANLLARTQDPVKTPSVGRFWEGVLLLDRGNIAPALEAFLAGLRGTSARLELGLAMMRALLRRGEAAAAETFAARAFAGFRTAAVGTEIARAVGETLHSGLVPPEKVEGVAAAGLRAAEATLARGPADTWVLTHAAEVRFAAGRIDEAVAFYDAALRDLPGDASLANNLAYLLALAGRDVERGLALVEGAIRKEPGSNVFYLDTRGWLRYRQGRLAEAEADVRSSLRRGDFTSTGSAAEGLFHLGVLRREQGDPEAATRAFSLASVNDPHGVYGGRARQELEALGVDPYHR